MRIIVTGGGTGGHIFPALEIIKEIKRQDGLIEVLYVGNKDSLEEKMANKDGLIFYGLASKKFVGQSLVKKCLALCFLSIAIFKSMALLLKKRPKAVIGVGGYISVPVLMASFLLGIDRYICEQNVVPGLANKILSRIAKRIFISFEESRRFFPKGRAILSGNPVRHQFFNVPAKKPEGLFKILVTGGSLGAQFLNREVPKALAEIASTCPNLSITHQVGQRPSDAAEIYKKANINAQVVAFIDNMPDAFSKHDLIISRAGATVCAEIMASGMPAILVPYPFANAHQQHNALALVSQKAAIMVLEDGDFKKHLIKDVKALYEEPKKLELLSSAAKMLGTPKASVLIASQVLNDQIIVLR